MFPSGIVTIPLSSGLITESLFSNFTPVTVPLFLVNPQSFITDSVGISDLRAKSLFDFNYSNSSSVFPSILAIPYSIIFLISSGRVSWIYVVIVEFLTAFPEFLSNVASTTEPSGIVGLSVKSFQEPLNKVGLFLI